MYIEQCSQDPPRKWQPLCKGHLLVTVVGRMNCNILNRSSKLCLADSGLGRFVQWPGQRLKWLVPSEVLYSLASYYDSPHTRRFPGIYCSSVMMSSSTPTEKLLLSNEHWDLTFVDTNLFDILPACHTPLPSAWSHAFLWVILGWGVARPDQLISQIEVENERLYTSVRWVIVQLGGIYSG